MNVYKVLKTVDWVKGNSVMHVTHLSILEKNIQCDYTVESIFLGGDNNGRSIFIVCLLSAKYYSKVIYM